MLRAIGIYEKNPPAKGYSLKQSATKEASDDESYFSDMNEVLKNDPEAKQFDHGIFYIVHDMNKKYYNHCFKLIDNSAIIVFISVDPLPFPREKKFLFVNAQNIFKKKIDRTLVDLIQKPEEFNHCDLYTADVAQALNKSTMEAHKTLGLFIERGAVLKKVDVNTKYLNKDSIDLEAKSHKLASSCCVVS